MAIHSHSYFIYRKENNMYILPNTAIYILHNIPLNKSYEHTVYYPNKDAQAQAFMKYKKFQVTDYSYQRAQLGTIRMQLTYEQLIDCNYLMFKNTSFENKWFYAFITGISYVSNEVTDVYYEIDVMQTWCYDYEFQKTFVERQHSTHDVLYENTQPEGLELGSDYEHDLKITINLLKDGADANFLILATTSSAGQHPTPSVQAGTLFSLYQYVGNRDDSISKLQEFINNGLEDNIVAIYSVPTVDSANQTKTFTNTRLKNGHRIRNKKLMSYPYSYIQCTNNLGQIMELKFENFRTNAGKTVDSSYNFKFSALTLKLPLPQSLLLVHDYLSSTSGADTSLYTLNYSTFPTGAYSGDAFKVWLAQNKNTYSASMNAIGNTYDTNQAIAQNNYTMAGLSASNARTNDHIQANSMLTQAENSNKTALAVNSANLGKDTMNNITGMVKNVASGAAMGGFGLNPVRTVVGAAEGALVSLGSMTTSAGVYNAQADAINMQLTNSQIGFNASEAVSANTMATAMKNATLAQTNAQLSALNTYQNATAQLVAKKQDIQHQPSNLHGQLMNDSWNGFFGNVGFRVYVYSIKNEYLNIIDDYFDKYGYAQRKQYIPSRQNRKHWSYLKTVGCNIQGNINNTDLVTIKGIYDNGITTWNNLEEVGNYALDNTIDGYGWGDSYIG